MDLVQSETLGVGGEGGATGRGGGDSQNLVSAIKIAAFHCQHVVLTDRVSGKDWISERTRQSRSSCIDRRHSEQVLGAFNQSSHHEGLAHAHWTDWVTGDACPAFSCCFFSFQPVTSNRGATIIFRFLPVDSHGVHGDTGDCWLFTLTGNSYRERKRLGVNSLCCGFSLNTRVHFQLTVKVSGHFRLTV